MNDPKLHLIFILERIERIRQYVARGRAAFLASTLIQDGVMRNLQVIAESTQRLPASMKSAHPEIDWVDLAGFRNVLVHNYLGIKLPLVWEAVEDHLPRLESAVQALLKGMES